jgi:uncharacterized protein
MRSSRILVLTALATLLGAGCVAPLLEPLEEPLIFRPQPLDEAQAQALAHANRIEEISVPTAEGLQLRGWLEHPPQWTGTSPHPLVIVYGGIGQEVSEFVTWAAAHASAARSWGWLMINYRGFGRSEGSPSERAVLSDARRIYDWALARPDVDPRNIVVLGRSLGSYVAIAVAATRKVRAAILATPFDSAAALGEDHLHGLPLGWLVQSRYNPALMAPLVSAPALFLLAEKDEVTPVKHGLALARRWGGTVKTVLLPGMGHSGVEKHDEFWNSIGAFLATLDESSLAMTSAAAAPAASR